MVKALEARMRYIETFSQRIISVPPFIKSVKGPLPHVQIMPTDGDKSRGI